MDERHSAEVIIYMKDIKIEGSIYTRDEFTRGRISDALNREHERFLAVTQAKIFDYEASRELDEKHFMFINKSQILYVKPKENINEQ